PMSGLIDEPRISTVVRSPQWISTEYNNTAKSPLFISTGPDQAYICGGGPYYVQSRSLHFQYTKTASVTLPYSTNPGDLLVLSFVINQSNSYATVSDTKNGAAAYNLVQMSTVGAWGRMYTFYVPNSAGGAGPITTTVTLTAPSDNVFDVFLLEYGGIATGSPLGPTSVGADTNSVGMNTSFQSITKAPSLIYAFGADDHTCHAALAYTDRETADGQCAIDETVFLTGSYNATATQNSAGAWAMQMVSFKGP
ncbi:MAG TPA: hypothetical protein VLV30_07410, partial [Methanomicrobiales archaeon]|nr:hypothetical protein [Methanomicrobiales archaeon]